MKKKIKTKEKKNNIEDEFFFYIYNIISKADLESDQFSIGLCIK